MTIVDMLGQSGILTVMGMGTVFGFLAILIVCVSLMGKVIHAVGADRPEGAAVTQGTKSAASSGANSAAQTAAVTAAITAAVNEYRKTENR
jgi:oxaloacetate decarboxylase gamma subunit